MCQTAEPMHGQGGGVLLLPGTPEWYWPGMFGLDRQQTG